MDSQPVSEEERNVDREVLAKVASSSCQALCQLLESLVTDTDKLDGVLITVSCVQRTEACYPEKNGPVSEIDFDTNQSRLRELHQAAKSTLSWEDEHKRDITTTGFLIKGSQTE